MIIFSSTNSYVVSGPKPFVTIKQYTYFVGKKEKEKKNIVLRRALFDEITGTLEKNLKIFVINN